MSKGPRPGSKLRFSVYFFRLAKSCVNFVHSDARSWRDPRQYIALVLKAIVSVHVFLGYFYAAHAGQAK
jgi:hypothetical protein